jgi:DNA-binding LacI/PurR family transcriptional regulator
MIDEREAGLREAIGSHPASAACMLHSVEYGSLMTPPDPAAKAALDAALAELLARPDYPTAIFCHNLQDAEQTYLRAEAMGRKIPHDLSLLYFGSTWRETALANRITCLAVDEPAIGATAVRLLHEMRTGQRPLDDNEQIVFPISVCPGETLGKAPSGASQGAPSR